jgi:hypothetical protein
LLGFRLGCGVGQRAFDEENGLRGDRGRPELTCGGHAVENFANAGAGGEGREEDFRFFGGGGDGGTQIEGEERGERGGLGGVGTGGELGGKAILKEGPARGGIGRVDGRGAEVGPELDEGTEYGGFGELAAEGILEFDGGHLAFAIQGFPGTKDDGGGPAPGRGFPLALAADGSDPGKDFGGGEEVGLFGKRAEEVEWDGAALVDEAGGERGGLGDGGGRWRDAGGAAASFDERRRGCGELRVAREKEAEAHFIEPLSGGVKSAQWGGGIRCGGLVPKRGARDL